MTRRKNLLIAVLLAAATVFFVVGAFAERSTETDTHASTPSGHVEGGGETPAEHATEGGGGESSPESSGESSGEHVEYRPLGVDLESTTLIVIAAIVSFALAGLVAFRMTRAVLVGVVVLCAVFVVFEILEVFHQADVDEIGLLLLALAACVLHVSAGAVAAHTLSARTPEVAPGTGPTQGA
jgi:hypothetical protein